MSLNSNKISAINFNIIEKNINQIDVSPDQFRFTTNSSAFSIHSDLKMILDQSNQASKIICCENLFESNAHQHELSPTHPPTPRRYTKGFLNQIKLDRAEFIQNNPPKVFKQNFDCMNGKYWDPEKYFDKFGTTYQYQRSPKHQQHFKTAQSFNNKRRWNHSVKNKHQNSNQKTINNTNSDPDTFLLNLIKGNNEKKQTIGKNILHEIFKIPMLTVQEIESEQISTKTCDFISVQELESTQLGKESNIIDLDKSLKLKQLLNINKINFSKECNSNLEPFEISISLDKQLDKHEYFMSLNKNITPAKNAVEEHKAESNSDDILKWFNVAKF